MKTCYMCEDAAKSMEHAPPSSFFPKVDLVGEDLRRNLITVPSCDTHNSKKSKDDEFLRAVLLLASGRSSKVADLQFHEKLLRAVRRKPEAHTKFVTSTGIRSSGGQFLRLDVNRFNRCIEQIARAIFFHTYNMKWVLPIKVLSPNLHAFKGDAVFVPEDYHRAIEDIKAFLINEPVKGENPKVFVYRTRSLPDSSTYCFGAYFYECFEVFCVSPTTLS